VSVGTESIRPSALAAGQEVDAQTKTPSPSDGDRPHTQGPLEPVEILIRPTSGWRALDLRELWRYRDLIYFLTMREVSVRYKQTILGAAWAILHPVMSAGIFTALFAILMGRGRMPSIPGVPYFVSTLAVMLPWQLFAHSMNSSGQSLVKHHRLVTKVYFPRLVVPLSASLAGFADFCVASIVVVGAMLYCRIPVTLNVAWLPLFILLAITASLAIGLWLSALNAMYRDFQHIIPFLVQVGMFATPVIYSIDRVRENVPNWVFQIYCLNPMVGVVEGVRWALFNTAPPTGLMLVSSILVTGVLFITGALYFRRMERTFADVV
jgi:lipopolysaccharide transport system permease protein